MVRPRCVVSYCENLGRHKFPKNEDRRKQWIEAIVHIKPRMTINTYSGICSDHFRINDFSVIPSYWNNYYSAKILKKSAVPSVFRWNKTPVDDQVFVEQPSSSTQDTLSFNPDRVKATYSRGQPTKQVKPNTVPSVPPRSLLKITKPQPQTNKQTQKPNSIINNIIYNRLKLKKQAVNCVNTESNGKFLPPATIINDKRTLKISSVPLNNSNIVGKVRIVVPQNNVKIHGETSCLSQNIGKMQGQTSFLPPEVTIKIEQGVETGSTDNYLVNNSEFVQDDMFTSCLPLEVNIKTEEDVEVTDSILPEKSTFIQDKSMLTSFLPPEVNIKPEKENKTHTMIEVEVDLLKPIKQEIKEEMADINLKHSVQNVEVFQNYNKIN